MSLMDEFENAFKACLAPFTNPITSHVFENDELKANVENVLQFLDTSRQLESFFIQKRAILIDQKPELILVEEINELKNEINRKDVLLTKYYDRLDKWTATLNENVPSNISGGVSSTGLISSGMQQMPGFRAPGPLPGGQPMMNLPPGMRPPPPGLQQQPSPACPKNVSPNIYYKQPGSVKSSGSPAAHFGELGVPSPMRGPRPSMQQASMSPGGSMGSPMGAVPSPHHPSGPYGSPMPGLQQSQAGNVSSQMNNIALLERTTSNIGMMDRKPQ